MRCDQTEDMNVDSIGCFVPFSPHVLETFDCSLRRREELDVVCNGVVNFGAIIPIHEHDAAPN
jgi:hypothetical protein